MSAEIVEESNRTPESAVSAPRYTERKKFIRTMRKDMERLLGHENEKDMPTFTQETRSSPDDASLSPPKKEGPRLRIPGKQFIVILTGLIVLILIGIGTYSWFSKKEEASLPQDPSREEPGTPEELAPIEIPFLIPVDSEETITLAKSDDFSTEAKRVLSKSYPAETIVGINIVKQNENGAVSLALGEFLDTFTLSIPPLILAEFEDTYTFSFWSGPASTNSPILILKFKPERTYESLQEEFSLWETTIEQDLATILDITGRKQERANSQFLDNTYKETPIRYLNFNDPNLSIDYAIIQTKDLFVITTSRESIYGIIDRIQ